MKTNKNSKCISIIIPVYNVEPYIEKCIESVINQTYQDLDIILVNDGSTDLSGDICDKYSKLDSRIRVIHQKNSGQSKARNVGISIARGEYIGFVDSDDYIELNMYEKLINTMEQYNADIVECAVKNIYTNKTVYNETKKIYICTGEEALKKHLEKPNDSKSPRAAVWSRLFKSEKIKSLKFPEGMIHEDFYFTYRALLNCSKYCWIDEALYCHIYTNSNSTTQLPFSKKDLSKINIFKERMDYLKAIKKNQLAKYAEVNYYSLLLQYFYKTSYNNMIHESEYLKKEIVKNTDKILRSSMSIKKKFEFIVFKVSPAVYLKIRLSIMSMR